MREVVLCPVDVPERGIHIQLPWQTGTCSELTYELRRDGTGVAERIDIMNRVTGEQPPDTNA